VLGALVVALATAAGCFSWFARRSDTAKEAEIQRCAGLGGPARADCERRHGEP
jgi:hypothetical protein